MALSSHELPSKMQSSTHAERAFPRIRILRSDTPSDAVPVAFAPTNDTDPDLSKARSQLNDKPLHTVYDASIGSILPTDRDLPYDNPIVTVGFIHDPDTKRTLDDFLKISVTQTAIERDKKRKNLFPRRATIFNRPQASLRRA